jgi:fatty-acyl-CoA synthase
MPDHAVAPGAAGAERTAPGTPSTAEVEMAEGASISWPARLRRHAHLQPDVVAFRFEGHTITYADLDRRVDAAAGALAALGVGPGDRVAALMGNRTEMFDVFGGAARLGAITVPINFRLIGREIAFLLGDSGAKVLVVDEDRVAEARIAIAEAIETGAGSDIPCLVIGDRPASDGTGSWDEAVAAAPPTPAATAATLEQWRAEAPTLIMYTSGTTGRPKGAVLTHLNLLMETVTRMQQAGTTSPGSVVMVVSPLFHIAGLMGAIPALIFGVTTVLVPTGAFDPAATLDLIEQEGVTFVFLVPTQWQAVCGLPDVGERRLRLQTIAWGASPALPSTLRAMNETFGGVANVAAFGQTEMSPVTCNLHGTDALTHIGSVGRAVPTVDVRVVDDDMRDVEQGGVGEIVYRGPSTMAGYWRNPEGTADALRGGWFHSGDLVRVDDEGFITVVDRKKDMIISGGENIYSSEVEAAIDANPTVREVAVVAGPHDRWVETPVAFVVPTDPSAPPAPEDIIAATAVHLASYKKPTRVEIVDVLPRNASGKVLKTELRQRLRNEVASRS